jgi:hypothetical protein
MYDTLEELSADESGGATGRSDENEQFKNKLIESLSQAAKEETTGLKTSNTGMSVKIINSAQTNSKACVIQ